MTKGGLGEGQKSQKNDDVFYEWLRSLDEENNNTATEQTWSL